MKENKKFYRLSSHSLNLCAVTPNTGNTTINIRAIIKYSIVLLNEKLPSIFYLRKADANTLIKTETF